MTTTYKAIVSTSANPFHYGHLDIFRKAEGVFGAGNVKVIIAQNSEKSKVSVDKIKFHMNAYNIPYEIVTDIPIVDYCADQNINFIVRGIRNGVDAEYELKLDFANKEINPNIQTIFIPTNDTFSNLSSSTIREFLKYKKLTIVERYMNKDALYRFINTKSTIPVYFGRSCVGKSTYIARNIIDHHSGYDVDKYLWHILSMHIGQKQADEIKNQSHQLFDQNKLEKITNNINKVFDRNYWDLFFNEIDNDDNKLPSILDWASVGNYWDSIPIEHRSRLKLIEFTCNETKRKQYIESKHFEHKIEKLDLMFKRPPIVDQTIEI